MPDRLVTLGRAISLWEGSLRASRKADRTIDGYVRAAEYLVEAHGPDADPRSMTPEDLELVAARWRGVTATTVRNRMVAWGQFFAWGARRYGWANPMLMLDVPRKDQPSLRRLTNDEVAAIATAALRMPTRDRVVVSVLAHLGIRRNELRALRWRDVDLAGGTMHITGKGRKNRHVPIPPQLAQVLLLAREGAPATAYLAHHITVKAETWIPNSGIYRPDTDRPCAPQTIDRIVKRCAELAGVRDPDDVTSHQFRRSLLERLLEAGHSPYIVAELAGHADIKTTAAYGGGASLDAVRRALLSDTTLENPGMALMGPEGFEPPSEPSPSAASAGSERCDELVAPEQGAEPGDPA